MCSPMQWVTLYLMFNCKPPSTWCDLPSLQKDVECAHMTAIGFLFTIHRYANTEKVVRDANIFPKNKAIGSFFFSVEQCSGELLINN